MKIKGFSVQAPVFFLCREQENPRNESLAACAVCSKENIVNKVLSKGGKTVTDLLL